MVIWKMAVKIVCGRCHWELRPRDTVE